MSLCSYYVLTWFPHCLCCCWFINTATQHNCQHIIIHQAEKSYWQRLSLLGNGLLFCSKLYYDREMSHGIQTIRTFKDQPALRCYHSPQRESLPSSNSFFDLTISPSVMSNRTPQFRKTINVSNQFWTSCYMQHQANTAWMLRWSKLLCDVKHTNACG